MARKPRVEFPGAPYHVIVRGNSRTTLFHDAADYHAYFARLKRYRRRDHLRCYAFILMANHVHLLVEPDEIPLARTIQTLQFTYTQYDISATGSRGICSTGAIRPFSVIGMPICWSWSATCI